jgi:hypothetical protein
VAGGVITVAALAAALLVALRPRRRGRAAG